MLFFQREWKWGQYLTREENWEVLWGQEMDRPQGGGMERVSLITLLQTYKRQQDRNKKGEGKRRWVINNHEQNMRTETIQTMSSVERTVVCVQIVPLWVSPVGDRVSVCCGSLMAVHRSAHKHTHAERHQSHTVCKNSIFHNRQHITQIYHQSIENLWCCLFNPSFWKSKHSCSHTSEASCKKYTHQVQY